MYAQIYDYMNSVLSPYLCGFRKGYNSQYFLILMLENWRKSFDNGKVSGALLTDLSKAFDCIDHELLKAKLQAYGFNKRSLRYVYSYLSERKHRTKVNTYLSEWSNIRSGILQGSILGPLSFDIYLNDIFYFIDGDWLAKKRVKWRLAVCVKRYNAKII